MKTTAGDLAWIVIVIVMASLHAGLATYYLQATGSAPGAAPVHIGATVCWLCVLHVRASILSR